MRILCGAILAMVALSAHGAVGALAVTNGAICLTFDDRNFDTWERCIPLFEKYGAHATFFVCGPIDARAESCMRKLSAAGHSIGLHGFKHQKATDALARLGEEGYLREEILPQLSVCREKGLDVRSFAYPMSARTAETDALLLRHFARLRAGWGEVDGKSWGEKTPPFHVGESVSRPVVVAQCGTNPADMPERIVAMMPQIAASNLVLTVYAHDIEAKGKSHNHHNITEEDLEKVLSAAKEAGVKVIGFDELPGGNICSTPFEKTHLAPFKKAQVNFTRQRIFPGFDGKLCKIQPSIATDGKGTALLGFQKLLLTGSDVFYGQFLSKSVDGGKTWSEPVEQTALADTVENGYRAARYATVRYSRAHGKWFALGMKQLYENDKVPFQKYVDGRPYGTPIYVSVDVEKGCFTDSKALEFPFEYEMALPFGQMLECDNDDLLACFYFRPIGGGQKGRCVTVRYAFEGDGLRVVKAGTPVVCDNLARGVGEPSLARLGDKVYMTLRSDEMGLWCVSDDEGMTFSKPRPWTWTDGKRIGNKNTQQHWMTCGGALFLAYTREDAANGHVFRNRAPIYMAQFDPNCGGLLRETEFPLVPELGARLGNFCVDFTGTESWLVTAEWMQPLGCEKYGSDNSIWLIRAK